METFLDEILERQEKARLRLEYINDRLYDEGFVLRGIGNGSKEGGGSKKEETNQ